MLISILDIAYIVITKVVPVPIPSLSTWTLPPIFSIICLQILSPRPVPYLLHPKVSCNFPKFKNNFPKFSLAIPMPESLILT